MSTVLASLFPLSYSPSLLLSAPGMYDCHKSFRAVLQLAHSIRLVQGITQFSAFSSRRNGSLEKFRLIYYEITVHKTSTYSNLMVCQLVGFSQHSYCFPFASSDENSLGQIDVDSELVFRPYWNGRLCYWFSPVFVYFFFVFEIIFSFLYCGMAAAAAAALCKRMKYELNARIHPRRCMPSLRFQSFTVIYLSFSAWMVRWNVTRFHAFYLSDFQFPIYFRLFLHFPFREIQTWSLFDLLLLFISI